MAEYQEYVYNITTAVDIMENARRALSDQNDILLQMRELVVSAQSVGTQPERDILGYQFSTLMDELDNVVSATVYDGYELFGRRLQQDTIDEYVRIAEQGIDVWDNHDNNIFGALDDEVTHHINVQFGVSGIQADIDEFNNGTTLQAFGTDAPNYRTFQFGQIDSDGLFSTNSVSSTFLPFKVVVTAFGNINAFAYVDVLIQREVFGVSIEEKLATLINLIDGDIPIYGGREGLHLHTSINSLGGYNKTGLERVNFHIGYVDDALDFLRYELTRIDTISTSGNYLEYSDLPNDWFSKCNSSYDTERELFKVVQMEAYNTFGVSIIFYKTTYNKKYDKIWGEDGERYITEYWEDVMSYFNLPREDKMWTKFGMEGMENFSMYVSKEHFEYMTSGYIPRMGDIIQTEYNNNLYEIVEVKEEAGMYMLSKQYTWEIIVRPYKVEDNISLSASISGAPIANYINTSDIFNIKNDIDVKKEDKLYIPKPTEKPVNDPFGNWS